MRLNMNKYVSALLFCPVLLCFLLLTGCATIVSGTTQSVSISTPPATAATCSLSNAQGKWYIPYTPSTVVIHKSSSSLDVECQKAGYYDGNQSVKSHVKPIIVGNVLFGGIVGLVIDIVDGAAFGYQENIQVPLVVKNDQLAGQVNSK